ncbi:MAG: hypothetical protein GVY18_12600, partial [Bacteroidetes bacterium]|nr:hypothetical protein [Bacteroidota bacterium]
MSIRSSLGSQLLVVIGCMLLSCGVLADGYGQGSDATVEREAPPASAADPATIDLRVVLDTLYAAARAGQASFDPCLADTLVMDLRTLPQAVLPPQVDLLGSGCVLDIRPAYYAYLPDAERAIGEAFFKVPRPPRRAHWVVEGLRIRQPVPSADTTVVRCNPTRIKDGGSWSRLARCMGLRQTWDIARSWDPVTRRGSTVRFEDYRCVGPGCNGPLRGSSARSDTLRRFHVETYGSVVYSASCGGGSQIKDSVYAYVEDSTIRGYEPPEWSTVRNYAARPQRHLMYASSCVGFDMQDVTFGPMPYADLHREAWGSRALMRTHGSQTRPATVEQHFWRTTVVGPGLVLNSPVQTTHWHEPRFTSLPGERRVTFNIPG